MNTKAIGYIRVSTDRQDISPEAQHERIMAYCAMQGLTLAVVIEDQCSGTIPLIKRPGGEKLLESIGFAENVIAVKLDRLFRNAADALQTIEAWDKQGITLHLVDMGGCAMASNTAMGKMMLTMLAGFAEFERNMIAERTAQALAHKRSKGEKTGGSVPFGNSVEVRGGVKYLVPDNTMQWIIKDVRELRAAGMTYGEIATQLTVAGLKTAMGKERWTPMTVARLVRV